MPLLCDWPTKVITIPKSEMTLVSGTHYQMTVLYWFQLLRELNGSAEGIAMTVGEPIYNNTPPTSSTPRIVDVINGYTVVVEDGLYSFEFINGNTNFRDVEIKNSVSVGTNNTTGFIDPTFLKAGLFAGGVAIDSVNGFAGTGSTPAGATIGTRQAPCNNINDAEFIANREGVSNFYLMNNFILDSQDLSEGYKFVGDNPFILLTMVPSADLRNCSFENLTVGGESDGNNYYRECIIKDITSLNGKMDSCGFEGTIILNGPTRIIHGYSLVSGLGYPTIDINGANELICREWNGSLGIKGSTGGTHTIHITGGRPVFDATCSGGDFSVRGNLSHIIEDNSGPGCSVFDNAIHAVHVHELWKHDGLDPENPKVTNEDGSTSAGPDISVGAVTTGVTPNRQTTQTRGP